MLKKLIAVLCLGAAAGAAWVALKPAKTASTPITVFCAAGMKKPVEEIAENLIKILLKNLDEGQKPRKPESVVLSTSLLIRDSSRKAG